MDIRKIRHPLVRLCLLLVIAIPLLSYSIVVSVSGPIGSFEFFLAWAVYLVLIYAIMIISVGIQEFAAWLAVAAVLAIVTLGTAALMFSVASWIGIFFSTASGDPYTQELWSIDLVKKAFAILGAIPYAIFSVNSFSAAGLAQKLSSRKRTAISPHIVIMLRMVQHMTEIIPQLFPVWQEANPKIVWPRHDEDIDTPLKKVTTFGRWLFAAGWRWATAILVSSWEPVPVYSHIIELHFSDPPSESATS